MAKAKQNKPVRGVRYDFKARLVESLYGNFTYSAAYLPKTLVEKIPAGRLRTKGTLNDIPFALAIQYRKDGQSFFLFSSSLCKKAGVQVGNSINISFRIVDGKIVELPEELEIVLAQDMEARRIWDSFSTGRRRSLALYVSPAKSIDVRIKRALDLAAKMKAGQLYSQIVRKNKGA